MAASSLSAEEQARHLEESMAVIRQHEAQMRRCLDQKGKLLDAIKHASTFLAELRTQALTPKQYYELYIAVFDALTYLGSSLKEIHPTHDLTDIYELVQYAGNIVPRLYLMVTVGTVYMSIPNAPVREIMKDMMEMCRGVQHPVRGLFLRYYLSQGARDNLPTSDTDGPEGSLKDSVQFVITNFIEMNKLWVRWQHQGHSREREQRTRERQQMQILVGSNLVRLSQLEGIDKDYYRSTILPAILEQVVQSRDVLAQEYLLDVICQVFPDEFHLHTLDLFLDSTSNLNPNVSVRKILLTMMNRLSDFKARERELSGADKLDISESKDKPANGAGSKSSSDENKSGEKVEGEEEEDDTGKDKDVDTDADKDANKDANKGAGKDADTAPEQETNGAEMDLFQIFWDFASKYFEVRQDLPLSEKTGLFVGLCRLSHSCYPDNMDNLDKVLSYAADCVKDGGSTVLDAESAANISELLVLLINSFPKFLSVLAIPSYLPLLALQPESTQRAISAAVLDKVLASKENIASVDEAQGVFDLLKVMIRVPPKPSRTGGVPGGTSTGTLGGSDVSSPAEAVYSEEQSKLAKVVHKLHNQDPDVHAKLLAVARNALHDGGAMLRFTYPALVTNALKLVRRYKRLASKDTDAAAKASSVYKFLHRVISEIANAGGKPELALRLYVTAATVADKVKAEEAAYEFLAEAFTLYEEYVTDSRAQYQALCIICGALQSSRNFSLENYDTLVSKSAQYGSKLLKKPDQCRSVYIASHLWWATENALLGEEEGNTELYRDDKRVLECLQRALRVADACMDVAVSVELFVEILNRYIYYFDHGNTEVTARHINGLIEVIQTNLSNNSDESTSTSPRMHFERTLQYISGQRDTDPRFQEIVW